MPTPRDLAGGQIADTCSVDVFGKGGEDDEGEACENKQLLKHIDQLVVSIIRVRNVANYMLQNSDVSSEQHLRAVVRALQTVQNSLLHGLWRKLIFIIWTFINYGCYEREYGAN